MIRQSYMAAARSGIGLLSVLLAAALPWGGHAAAAPPFNRSSFPEGFIFGTASAAYQYEGAAREGGRGPSIWDTFTHQHPDKIADRSNGDVAVDQYHRYKEDVGIMKTMGLDAYRFSISWPRVLPHGTISGGVNKEGIAYYNNLINELLSKGIQPFVTLFHWDSPQALEDEYLGFLSRRIVDDYVQYAELCFKEFGDRVKHWITFNEPWSFCSSGYATGTFAPGRCSPQEQGKCKVGNSGTEPYIAAYHQLLAHAQAVRLYQQKYQSSQKGKIGITLVSHWFYPYANQKSDVEARQRALDFMLGWFLNPLTYGDYPKTMKALVGDRLPKFTEQESKLITGSFDFIGINYYTSYYAKPLPSASNQLPDYDTDSRVAQTGARNGVPIGPVAASVWLYIYPPGFRQLLLYVKERYNNPIIYITENGVDEVNNKTLTLEEALQDDTRIKYYYEHLLFLRLAIRDGVDVRGYFAWSLLDNFEWNNGYTVRFGINFVDYNDGLKRYPKKSAYWFTKFLKK